MKNVNVYKVFLHEGEFRINDCSFGSSRSVKRCFHCEDVAPVVQELTFDSILREEPPGVPPF